MRRASGCSGSSDRIGYVPNLAARSLVSRRSRIVAAVVPSIGNAMFAETLHGMSDVLRQSGYFLVVAHSGYSPQRGASRSSRRCSGSGRCGIFLHNTVHRAETVDLLRKQQVPVIETGDLTGAAHRFGRQLFEPRRRPGDDRASARPGLPADRVRERARGATTTGSSERRRGYHAALRAAGLRPDPAMEFEGEPGSGQRVRVCCTQILAGCPDVDAVFFASERLAIGAFFEAQRLGMQVPGRLAIAGFDFYEMNSQVYPARHHDDRDAPRARSAWRRPAPASTGCATVTSAPAVAGPRLRAGRARVDLKGQGAAPLPGIDRRLTHTRYVSDR